MNLLCIPYAGATPVCYQCFKRYLPEWLHLTTAVLPGRGLRANEKACILFNDAIEDICNRYIYIFESGDYALFGHSMGSTMVYELTYKMIEKGLPLPKHLFFSGRTAPQQSYQHEKITDKNPNDFKKKIIKLGGIPEELLKNPDVLDYFLKQIYEDILLLEDYSYLEGRPSLECDISVFYGREDELFSQAESDLWKQLTKKKCNVYGFSGNHFFIESHAEEIVDIFCRELFE
ncbi:MAG: thioesterase [Coprococcus sp.]|nr:thioesterase [Coprococcus sp.]